MEEYFLTTKRVGFRCWSEDDLPLAMGLWGDAEVTALIGGPFSAERVRSRLSSEIAQMRERSIQYWPVFLLEDGSFAGCAGLRPYQPEARIYELGVHLRGALRGKGLAREAAEAVIAYGFETLNVKAIFAGHHPMNERSRRMLLGLGFMYTHEELYAPTRLMHPSYLLHRD